MHNVRASEPYETDMQGIWKYARHLKHAKQHQLIKKRFWMTPTNRKLSIDPERVFPLQYDMKGGSLKFFSDVV